MQEVARQAIREYVENHSRAESSTGFWTRNYRGIPKLWSGSASDLPDLARTVVCRRANSRSRLRSPRLRPAGSRPGPPESYRLRQGRLSDLDAKAAALLHSIARNHALIDGNKRLALARAHRLLRPQRPTAHTHQCRRLRTGDERRRRAARCRRRYRRHSPRCDRTSALAILMIASDRRHPMRFSCQVAVVTIREPVVQMAKPRPGRSRTVQFILEGHADAGRQRAASASAARRTSSSSSG